MSANTQVKPTNSSPGFEFELRPDGLQLLRTNRGWITDRELAERIGINQSNLSRVLSGKAKPGVKFVAGAVQAFGVDDPRAIGAAFVALFEIVPDTSQEQAVA